MGYALTDGSVGVHFNDSTTIVLSPNKQYASSVRTTLYAHHYSFRHVDYISSRKTPSLYIRKHYPVANFPEELKSKMYLLKHFEKYMMDRLYGDYEYVFQALDRTQGMDFVQKYLRMKQVIVFKLSHDVLQVSKHNLGISASHS